MQFATTASGRAYFGFGAGPNGTLSLVAAPNSGQLILQDNSGWNYTQLAAVNQTWQANHWYRLEVDWGSSGTIVAKLYDSTGALAQYADRHGYVDRLGGFAFRTTGSTTYWDTVTDARSVNTFAVPAAAASSLPAAGSAAAMFLSRLARPSLPHRPRECLPANCFSATCSSSRCSVARGKGRDGAGVVARKRLTDSH